MTADVSKLNAYVALKPPSGAKASKLNAYAILKPEVKEIVPSIVNTVFFSEEVAPGWTPPASDKLLYWLRADEGVLNGDGQPAADGEKVATWQSGGIKGPAIQSTDANRLTYRTDGLNGKPYLLGNAAAQTFFDDIDLTQPSGITNVAPFTVFIVTRNVDVAAFPAILGSLATNGGKVGFYFRPTANEQVHFTNGDMRKGNYQNPSLIMGAKGRNKAGRTNNPFAQYWLRQNEVDLYAESLMSTNNDSSAIASTQFLRCSVLSTGGYFNGEIYEFLLYEGTLNDADTYAIEEHLAVKYGTRGG